MKILWVADAPWVNSGYGIQTKLQTRILRDLGHEVTIIARGAWDQAVTNWEGMRVYPKHGHSYAYDVIDRRARDVDADVVVTLHDLVTATPELIKKARWCPYFPVDTELPSPVTVKAAQHSWYPFTMTEWGRDAVNRIGVFSCGYMPHAIGDEFVPSSSKAARERVFPEVDNDAFLVTMVAANQSGSNNRKGLVEGIYAFSHWAHEHDDAILYLHTLPGPQHRQNAVNIEALIAGFGIQKKVRMVEPVRYLAGEITPEAMADIYRASDVLLSPSHMEGCNVPLLEAHAVGTPAIFGEWQGPRDHVTEIDYIIPVSSSEPYWNEKLMSFLQKPHLAAIYECLDKAYADRPNRDARRKVAADTRKKHGTEAIASAWKEMTDLWETKIAAEETIDSEPDQEHAD